MIEGIELCKRFGEKELFNNLSFQIDDGEFICFSGESGKGKTTLLNMIGKIVHKKCDIILADEPTGSLDSQNANMVINILKTLNAQAKPLYWSHTMKLLKSFATGLLN
jgi:ABC-type lipoprotein export system ATPase subunit